jgi:hypothetical protein
MVAWPGTGAGAGDGTGTATTKGGSIEMDGGRGTCTGLAVKQV